MDRHYFPHDFNARNDPKLQKLLMEHGMAAIGVYWCIVEMMYEQGGELPLDCSDSIAYTLHVDAKLVQNVFVSELFYTKQFCIRSHSVDKRIKKQLTLSEKRRKAVLTRWKSKEKTSIQMYNKCNTSELQTEYNCNTIKENKIKINKTNNIIKENKKENSSSSLIEEKSWSDAVMMKHHITQEQLVAYLSEFEIDQRCRGGTEHDSEKDLKQHFANWLMIKCKKEREEKQQNRNPLGLYDSAEKDYKAGGW